MNVVVSIEDVMEEKLVDALQDKYGADSAKQAYLFLLLKYWIFNHYEKVHSLDYFFARFVLREVGVREEVFVVEGVKCSIGRYSENSLLLLLDNLDYRYGQVEEVHVEFDEYSMQMMDFVKKKWRSAPFTKAALGSRYKEVKNILFAYWGLSWLNTNLLMKNHLGSFSVYKQTFEKDYMYQIKLAAKNYINISELKEVDIENYVFQHLEELFGQMKPIARQMNLGEGRLDIWARETVGSQRDVIIEIKNEVDNGLLVQLKNYRKWFEERYSFNPRLIAVSTKWTAELVAHLMEEKIEVYEIQFIDEDLNKLKYFKKIDD